LCRRTGKIKAKSFMVRKNSKRKPQPVVDLFCSNPFDDKSSIIDDTVNCLYLKNNGKN